MTRKLREMAEEIRGGYLGEGSYSRHAPFRVLVKRMSKLASDAVMLGISGKSDKLAHSQGGSAASLALNASSLLSTLKRTVDLHNLDPADMKAVARYMRAVEDADTLATHIQELRDRFNKQHDLWELAAKARDVLSDRD